MAIFNTQKKKKSPAGAPQVGGKKSAEQMSDLGGFLRSDLKREFSSVLLRPRITEKASQLAENHVYVFEIRQKANKKEVADAVKNIYKVTPLKVRITNLPAKTVFSRGKKGVQSAVKKAVVYLKEGDKIELV